MCLLRANQIPCQLDATEFLVFKEKLSVGARRKGDLHDATFIELRVAAMGVELKWGPSLYLTFVSAWLPRAAL